MINSTTFSTFSTFAHGLIHEEHNPADLYSTLDFSSLSWFEKQWAAWYIMVGNPVLATGLMSFLLHEVRCVMDRVDDDANFLNDWLDRSCILDGVYLG